MTNTDLLKEKIEQSPHKVYYIAGRCGLSYQGFMNKVNGKSDFTAPQILILEQVLGLSLEEVRTIFFAGDVDDVSTRGK